MRTRLFTQSEPWFLVLGTVHSNSVTRMDVNGLRRGHYSSQSWQCMASCASRSRRRLLHGKARYVRGARLLRVFCRRKITTFFCQWPHGIRWWGDGWTHYYELQVRVLPPVLSYTTFRVLSEQLWKRNFHCNGQAIAPVTQKFSCSLGEYGKSRVVQCSTYPTQRCWGSGFTRPSLKNVIAFSTFHGQAAAGEFENM